MTALPIIATPPKRNSRGLWRSIDRRQAGAQPRSRAKPSMKGSLYWRMVGKACGTFRASHGEWPFAGGASASLRAHIIDSPPGRLQNTIGPRAVSNSAFSRRSPDGSTNRYEVFPPLSRRFMLFVSSTSVDRRPSQRVDWSSSRQAENKVCVQAIGGQRRSSESP